MASEEDSEELRAGPDDAGRRLDKVLRRLLEDSSLSAIYAALRKGAVRVNGKRAKADQRLAEGDRIALPSSLAPKDWPAPPGPPPSGPGADGLEALDDILLVATEDLLFVNKPRGLVSQGSDELEGRIRRALASKSAGSLAFVPRPLHRLDRNTTGAMAFPRSAAGARAFADLVKRRAVEKRYLALVDGEVDSPAEWLDRIARDSASRRSSVATEGASARASMRPLLTRVDGAKSLILVELHTGLTHQIRVQASSRGHPLSGDSKYGGSRFAGGYILHAFSLGFPEPPFPDLPRRVTAPLPPSALRRLQEVFGARELDAALADLEV